MMAATKGYWVDSASGVWREILEHENAILTRPGDYGFSRGELDDILARTPPGKKRAAVLTAAMRKGWVRVRFTRERRVAEFWEGNECVLASLGTMLRDTGAWPSERIELHELASGRAWAKEAGELMELAGKMTDEK